MTRAYAISFAKALAPMLVRLRAKDGVNGKDGAPGRDGRDGANGRDGKDGAIGAKGERGTNGENGLDGKDGLNGKDGRDASLKDAGCFIKMLSERSYCWCWPDGTPIEVQHLDGTRSKSGEIRQEALLDRGVYEAGASYEKGDVVTWDGHMWIAQKATRVPPGQGTSDWRLSVRRGKQGEKGPRGEKGADGRDLTQMDETGRKWG